jgi:hypothetical protein
MGSNFPARNEAIPIQSAACYITDLIITAFQWTFFQVICLPVCCSQVSALPDLSLSNFDLCLLMHKDKIQGKGQYNHHSSDTCSSV